jgi:prepilin-type N-terminal cleavage/methylation domain-containing protein
MIVKLFRENLRLPRLNESGFTLIESMVALAVLSIGIVVMYAMQTGSVRGNYLAQNITTASAWAVERMEEINGLDYDDDLLDDRNNDGTGQDTNGNGKDDDDDVLGAVDNILNFGLDQNTTATADFTNTDLSGFTMHYNIAVDHPLEKMKIIRVIVVRNADQQQLVFDYAKTGSL